MIQFAYIEEYLECISGYRNVVNGLTNPLIFYSATPIISLARYDVEVVSSMTETVRNNKALTERQSELAIKIVCKYKKQLAALGVDITPAEQDPKFRITPRQMDYGRYLYLKDDKLVLRFPYNALQIESLKEYKKKSFGAAEFHFESKTWRLGLTEYNLNWAFAFAIAHQFGVDAEVRALIDMMLEAEKTDYRIELNIDAETSLLDISNCPMALRAHIEEKMGGFSIDNLEKLVDAAGELCYTVSPELTAAMKEQYGPLFTKLATIKEIKIPNITQEKFKEILDYAIQTKRLPVVIYEPDLSSRLFDMVIKCYNDKHIQHIYASRNTEDEVDPTADFVLTVKTIRNMDYIPMLISTAGMVYGSSKQVMFQRAGKVVYVAEDVYRGVPGTNKPNLEKFEF